MRIIGLIFSLAFISFGCRHGSSESQTKAEKAPAINGFKAGSIIEVLVEVDSVARFTSFGSSISYFQAQLPFATFVPDIKRNVLRSVFRIPQALPVTSKKYFFEIYGEKSALTVLYPSDKEAKFERTQVLTIQENDGNYFAQFVSPELIGAKDADANAPVVSDISIVRMNNTTVKVSYVIKDESFQYSFFWIKSKIKNPVDGKEKNAKIVGGQSIPCVDIELGVHKCESMYNLEQTVPGVKLDLEITATDLFGNNATVTEASNSALTLKWNMRVPRPEDFIVKIIEGEDESDAAKGKALLPKKISFNEVSQAVFDQFQKEDLEYTRREEAKRMKEKI